MNDILHEVYDSLMQARKVVYEAGDTIPPGDLNDIAVILASLKMLNEAQNVTTANESSLLAPSVNLHSVGIPETFAEWANRYAIKTHFDRFLAIAMYLHEKKGKLFLDTKDMMQMYEKARWKKPKNLADVFSKAAEKLLFTEAEDEETTENELKQWRMTQTGHDYFESLRLEETT